MKAAEVLLATRDSRIVYQAAKRLGQNPLAALGLDAPALIPELALLVMRLDNPEMDKAITDELEAQALAARMAAEEAWEDALPGGTGYRGVRPCEPLP